jgi:CheY-like chemotaxis protein
MRVLLAEDERNTREALVSILEHLGHEVTAVPDGQAAIGELETCVFDVLFTDLRMPGRDGDAVIAFGLSRDPRLKIVVLSAYIQRSLEALEPAQRAGLRFLIKPFRARDIKRVMDALRAEHDGRAT